MTNFLICVFALLIYHLRWINNGIISVTSEDSNQSLVQQFIQQIKELSLFSVFQDYNRFLYKELDAESNVNCGLIGHSLFCAENKDYGAWFENFSKRVNGGDQEFWIGKLTPYQGNQNQVIFCGIRTHTDSCGGIKIHLNVEGDTTISIKTKAHNTKYRNYILYTGKLYISNDSLQEKVDQLQMANPNQTPTDVPQFPVSLTQAIASPFKILAIGEGYVICQDTNGAGWVLYSSSFVKSKKTQNPSFIAEVDQKCNEFNMQNLQNINTVFPDGTNFIFSGPTY